MALHDDTLDVARFLLSPAAPPTDAAFRKSASASYYSVFHLLIFESASLIVPAKLREKIARAFEHRDMKRAGSDFLGQPASAAAPQLRQIARAFIDLQERRHDGDYDTLNPFGRSEAARLLASAGQAFLDMNAVRGTAQAEEFLIDLLAQSVRKR